MAAQTALVSARIETSIKNQAAANLENMGLTVSDAIRIVLTRVAKQGNLPIELTLSEKQYDAWFREKVREAMNEEGDGISHEEAIANARKIIAKNAGKKKNAKV